MGLVSWYHFYWSTTVIESQVLLASSTYERSMHNSDALQKANPSILQACARFYL